MVMFDFFKSLFRKEGSSATAKERLRLVLLSDHLSLAPHVVEALKSDLLAVLSRYVEIDAALADVTFEQREHEVAMLASVPILRLRDEAALALPDASLPEMDSPASPEAVPAGAVETTAEPVAKPAPSEPERSGANGSSSRRRRRRKAAKKGQVLALAAASGGPPAQGLPLASHP